MYVAHEGGEVSIIETATNSLVGAPLTLGGSLRDVAVNPIGDRVYVANFLNDTLEIIDPITNTLSGLVDLTRDTPPSCRPVGLAVHPVGNRVYVVCEDGYLGIRDGGGKFIATVNFINPPFGVAVHPLGSFVYVTHPDDDRVSVIDAVANTLLTDIVVGGDPTGVVVHPNGKFVYVTNQRNGTVSIINTATNTVLGTVNVLDTGSGGPCNACNPQSIAVGILVP